jgi:hypothetical protein
VLVLRQGDDERDRARSTAAPRSLEETAMTAMTIPPLCDEARGDRAHHAGDDRLFG